MDVDEMLMMANAAQQQLEQDAFEMRDGNAHTTALRTRHDCPPCLLEWRTHMDAPTSA